MDYSRYRVVPVGIRRGPLYRCGVCFELGKPASVANYELLASDGDVFSSLCDEHARMAVLMGSAAPED